MWLARRTQRGSAPIGARCVCARNIHGWFGWPKIVSPVAFANNTGASNCGATSSTLPAASRRAAPSYTIQFVSYDDESNTKRVQQLYTRLILNDKADFLFSPYSSSLTATAAIVTEQYGKIMLTTGAAEEKTYKLGNHYLYQMFAPDKTLPQEAMG